jgi:hypothetical protein
VPQPPGPPVDARGSQGLQIGDHNRQDIHIHVESSSVARPQQVGSPSGRALLNDPVEILGYGELRVRAESSLKDEPAAAAKLYAELSLRMDEKGFTARAEQLRALQRDAYEAAGNIAAAFDVTMRLLLDRYDAGHHLRSETTRAATLANVLGPPATDVALVGAALADWFEDGYDLAPVTTALEAIVAADNPLAGRLVLAVAEQIVTDEDPADDPEPLCTVARNLVGRLTDTLRIRLECCVADLAVRTGTDPTIAFDDLIRRADGIRAPLAALALRRAARALSFAGRRDGAIKAYQDAVRAAAETHHGGDARDALRSISYLSTMKSRQDAMDSARSVVTHDRLLPGADHAALSALEYLVDEELPDALREAHQWVRHERISGALLGEVVARRRYGEVFARAGEPAAAVPQLVLAGARKNAVRAAESSTEYVDVLRFLTRYPHWVQSSAAAVVRVQADLAPDSDVDDLAAKLLALVEASLPADLFGRETLTHAVGALAALDWRLPAEVARTLLPPLRAHVRRDAEHNRFPGDEMLAFFAACARLDAPDVVRVAVEVLVEALRQQVHRAERHVGALDPETIGLTESLEELANEGNSGAITVLAEWHRPTPAVISAARSAAQEILDQPVGTVRNNWVLGNTAPLAARLLRAALSPDGHADPEVTELRDRVAEHLLAWAEDRQDMAPSRRDAVAALRILQGQLPSDFRAVICRRLLAVHDEPGLHPNDLQDQASLHPLSRFRVNTGSEHLPADCLYAAALVASTNDEAAAVEQRLLPALAAAVTDPVDAGLRARTAFVINQIRALPLDLLAAHPAPVIRQAAVACWASQADRDPAMAAMFARDSDRGVRWNLAHELARLRSENAADAYRTILAELEADRSAQVRQATAARRRVACSQLVRPTSALSA